MAELPNREFLRVEEVADFYDVSRQCVYLWEQHGKINGVRKPGKPLMITRESVLNWEAELTKIRAT